MLTFLLNGVFMYKFDSPLNNIKVASPCPADWNEMYGDNRKRFCGDCKLNVYNLSGMTRDEAEALIINAEGRLCVRFYRRADGSVLTADCPVGWAKVKHRTRVFASAAFSLVMALFTGVFFVSLLSRKQPITGKMKIPFTTSTPEHTVGVMVNRNTNTDIPPNDRPVMGKYVTPPKPSPQKRLQEIKGEIDISPGGNS